MEAAGFEPSTPFLQVSCNQNYTDSPPPQLTPKLTQPESDSGTSLHGLAQVVENWPKIPDSLKALIVGLAQEFNKERGV